MRSLIILSLLAVTNLALTGCSSTPRVVEQPIGQYCYTEEQIVNRNGVVSSETRVECSDKPKINHVVRTQGVAQQCREYVHMIQVGGVNRNVKGFLCRFPNGVWEPVNSAFAY